MKFTKEYDTETGQFFTLLTINVKLTFIKDLPGVRGKIQQWFESGTVGHFTNYVIPTIETWIPQNPDHFTTIPKGEQIEKVDEEVKVSTTRIIPVATKTIPQFTQEISEVFKTDLEKVLSKELLMMNEETEKKIQDRLK